MKNLHPIHQTPEQRLASVSEKTLAAVEKATQEIVRAVKGKPVPDFSPLIEALDALTKKTEEVKSAVLANTIAVKKVCKQLESK